jgi:hypothetical protein
VQCEPKRRIAPDASVVDLNQGHASRGRISPMFGLVGRGPGKYQLCPGAAFDGSRLNRRTVRTSGTASSLPRSRR